MKLESGVAEDDDDDNELAVEHWDERGELGAVLLDGDVEERSRV